MNFLYWLIVSICSLFIMNVVCFADCSQDPNTLNPQMKKAYYEFKKACGNDCAVSIRCGKDIL